MRKLFLLSMLTVSVAVLEARNVQVVQHAGHGLKDLRGYVGKILRTAAGHASEAPEDKEDSEEGDEAETPAPAPRYAVPAQLPIVGIPEPRNVDECVRVAQFEETKTGVLHWFGGVRDSFKTPAPVINHDAIRRRVEERERADELAVQLALAGAQQTQPRTDDFADTTSQPTSIEAVVAPDAVHSDVQQALNALMESPLVIEAQLRQAIRQGQRLRYEEMGKEHTEEYHG